MIIKVQNVLNDYNSWLNILIDGKEVFSAGDNEPEDNTLGRNFNDCYKIPDLMKLAYEAGKAGASFQIEQETIQSDE